MRRWVLICKIQSILSIGLYRSRSVLTWLQDATRSTWIAHPRVQELNYDKLVSSWRATDKHCTRWWARRDRPRARGWLNNREWLSVRALNSHACLSPSGVLCFSVACLRCRKMPYAYQISICTMSTGLINKCSSGTPQIVWLNILTERSTSARSFLWPNAETVVRRFGCALVHFLGP